LPVVNAATGLPLADDARALGDVLRSILVEPGNFLRCTEVALAHVVDTLVDLGPGVEVAHLASSATRGRALQVLAAAEPAAHAALLDVRAAPARPAPWSALAPIAVDEGFGPRLDNRFTRATGRAPFIVPGMTPSTAVAPLVVAAANAGYLAELAGGGQVTEAHLRARLEEIRLGLEPGQGVVFNALYLDPYLWGLHLGKERLVFKLKDEGYPILGVTITAGMPPLEEAVALLDELHAHGMHTNAVKPGNDRQVDEAIAIAKARPERPLFVHLEGGKAGGHHSWEDLEDLLCRHYAKLRAQENLVLCVGGGVGTEEQANAFLFGTWSEAQGRSPMPVDAVFLGTRLMATEEACTSSAVKEALVRAAGDAQRWPVDGKSAGGVASG
jgi:fatty acid synthase